MTTRHCTPDCVPGDCRHDWNPPPLGSQVGAAKARIGVHFTATRWHLLEDGTTVIDEVHIHDTVLEEVLGPPIEPHRRRDRRKDEKDPPG